jgi:transposase
MQNYWQTRYLLRNALQWPHASAIPYSLVETAKANGLVVHDYISKCLQHIAKQPNNLERRLPWNIERS